MFRRGFFHSVLIQKTRMNKITLFIAAILLILGLNHCGKKQVSENYTPPKPTNLSGEELAKSYCGSCHQFPSPDLLDKKTWEHGVLPKMALRLGMGDLMQHLTSMDYEEMMTLSMANIFPDKPVLAKEDWQKIVAYYLKNAPQKLLPQINKQSPRIGLKGFVQKTIWSPNVPLVTLVKFRPEQKLLYVGLRRDNRIDVYSTSQKRVDSLSIKSPVSDIVFGKDNSLQLLTMGIMDPNDQRKGQLVQINSAKQQQLVLDSLRRPVQMTIADLNQDGKEDKLICNFGNELGQLVWYEAGSNTAHILKEMPGARVAIVQDMNGDKLPDIVVLMTQARESVVLFTNKGKGVFDEQELLSFPPVYGSSYLQLVDFNKDGFQDLLYTNGDNADLSISLKRYHGVHVFLNNQHNQFKEGYFYPMYGASKAMAADFDMDGDMDIAAISFFIDPKQKPNEGFLYFENKGDLTFSPSTFKEASSGSWMVMDVADMDADGDQDIVLGSFMLNRRNDATGKSKQKMPAAIILENKRGHL